MTKANHILRIAELSESEGIFTTAQAERMGVPRDALHDAVMSGRLERVARGAYRLVGSGSSFADELVAAWKLTAPAKFSHERMRVSEWDGVAVGGHSAASLLGFGDFHLSPYRMYSPKRINTRNPLVHITTRLVPRDDVTFTLGFPVTRPERTIFDLVVDNEDLSLITDALRDAAYEHRDFDFEKLLALLKMKYTADLAEDLLRILLDGADLTTTEVA